MAPSSGGYGSETNGEGNKFQSRSAEEFGIDMFADFLVSDLFVFEGFDGGDELGFDAKEANDSRSESLGSEPGLDFKDGLERRSWTKILALSRSREIVSASERYSDVSLVMRSRVLLPDSIILPLHLALLGIHSSNGITPKTSEGWYR